MLPVLRSTTLEPISLDVIKKTFPSVFATAPRKDVSDRYALVETHRILAGMMKAGFVPVEVRAYNRRDSYDSRFAKHLIRFRKKGDLQMLKKVGDVVPQVVFINSHDRTSHAEMYAGLYRLLCSNGLLVSAGNMVEPLVIRHTGNIMEEVVAASKNIIASMDTVSEYVQLMQRVQMTEPQRVKFASTALKVARPERAGMFEGAALLVPRRPADEGNDVWSVYNRVQENLSKGGIVGHTASNRRTRTTEIKAIGGDVRINKAMWELAMQAIAKAKAK